MVKDITPNPPTAPRQPTTEPIVGGDGKPIPHTMDARAWAKDFVNSAKRNTSIPFDEATMATWFANSLMAGYDEGQRRAMREVSRIAKEMTEKICCGPLAVAMEPRRCKTCDEPATVHIKEVGLYFCDSCLKKIDARIAQINAVQK